MFPIVKIITNALPYSEYLSFPHQLWEILIVWQTGVMEIKNNEIITSDDVRAELSLDSSYTISWVLWIYTSFNHSGDFVRFLAPQAKFLRFRIRLWRFLMGESRFGDSLSRWIKTLPWIYTPPPSTSAETSRRGGYNFMALNWCHTYWHSLGLVVTSWEGDNHEVKCLSWSPAINFEFCSHRPGIEFPDPDPAWNCPRWSLTLSSILKDSFTRESNRHLLTYLCKHNLYSGHSVKSNKVF